MADVEPAARFGPYEIIARGGMTAQGMVTGHLARAMNRPDGSRGVLR